MVRFASVSGHGPFATMVLYEESLRTEECPERKETT